MKRILVVDDDQDLVTMVKISLEAQGYFVKSICDGDRIKENISEFSPNLILMDIYLGDHNGIDICKEIKENKETKHINIVLISSHHKNLIALDEFDSLAFIHKPFSVAQLHSIIEKEIGS